MSRGLALENLLRPPVELYSAVCAWLFAVIIFMYPMLFLLTDKYESFAIILLLLFGLYRGLQGFKILRYQKHLHRLPKYSASMDEIPVSQKVLFLGKGFKWLPIHTQRLRDLNKPENTQYAEPSKRSQRARRFERYAEQTNSIPLNQIAKLTQKDSWLNPVRPLPPVGGIPAIHGVSMQEENITMPLSDKGNHTLVLGTTGVGKTRLAEILITQDIRRGDVVIVIDPKGDVDLLKRMYSEAKASKRENDLLIFHLGFPESSVRYNPIGNFSKITEIATRVANQLPGSGESSAFKEFGWRFINIISIALAAMGITPTYKILRKYIYDMESLFNLYIEKIIKVIHSDFDEKVQSFINLYSTEKKRVPHGEAIIQVATELSEDDDILKSLIETCRYDKTYYDKITASLGPLLDKLTTGKVSALLSPDYEDAHDKREIFDWMQVIRGKKIVYVGLDALTDATVATAVGNAMLADLKSVAGGLYKNGLDAGFPFKIEDNKPTIALHTDEFNEVAADEFTQLLNKGRGAGFNITAYTQTASDIEVRLGGQAQAGQNLGNLNNIIMMRVKEEKTAELLIKQLPRVPIIDVTAFSGASDSALPAGGVYFNSNNEDRLSTKDEPMLSSNDLLNLPKGQAFCLIHGGQLYKIRIPLPKFDEGYIPETIQEMAKQKLSIDYDWQTT